MLVNFHSDFLVPTNGFTNSIEFQSDNPNFSNSNFVKEDGTPWVSPIVKNIPMHITECLWDIFNAYNLNSLKYTFATGITEKKEKIDYVTLDTSIHLKKVFQLFTKIGINKAALKIGVVKNDSGEIQKLFLEKQFIKTLISVNPNFCAGMVANIIAIFKAYEYLHIMQKTPFAEIGSSFGTSSMSISEDIKNIVFSVVPDSTVSVEELSYDNLAYALLAPDAKSYEINSVDSKIETTWVYSAFVVKSEDKTAIKERPYLLFSKKMALSDKYVYLCFSTGGKGIYTSNEGILDLDSTNPLFNFVQIVGRPIALKYDSDLSTIFAGAKEIAYFGNMDAISSDMSLNTELNNMHTSIENYLNAGESKSFRIIEDSLADVAQSLSTAYKIKLVGDATTSFDSLKEEYKDDEYAQQLYSQIQPYYETFNIDNLTNNIPGFCKGIIYSMMFTGSSGTGKSTAARVFATRCGLPYVSINLSQNIEEADLFGAMIPNPCKITPEDAEFIWKDGIITTAVRNGYVAILEEINFARPGVLGKLNSLLDENRQIDLTNGEIVKAHKNFRIIATCNISYEGTNRMNKAFLNRFNDCTIFKELSKAEAIRVIIERTGYRNAKNIEVIYAVYEAIQKYSVENKLTIVISLRQLLNIFTMGKFYKSAKDAVERIMLNAAFLEEDLHLEEFEKSVLSAFDLRFRL